MNINTEKICEDSLDIVKVITKSHFDFKWKWIKAAMDALVYSQTYMLKQKTKQMSNFKTYKASITISIIQ